MYQVAFDSFILPVSRHHFSLSHSSITTLDTFPRIGLTTMPNSSSQSTRRQKTAQISTISQITDISPAEQGMNGMISVRGWRYKDNLVVKAKVAVRGITIAVRREQLEDEGVALPFHFRILPDATCEVYVAPESVLDEEQIDNLDEDTLAVHITEDGEVYLTVPGLKVVHPVFDFFSGEISTFTPADHNST